MPRARRDRHMSLQELSEGIGDSASTSTISRVLSHAGLPSRMARNKPLLNFRTKQKRLQWARQHVHWSVDDWCQVWFTDESAVRRHSVVKRTVRRGRHEAFVEGAVQPRVAHGGGVGAHVWGGIRGGAAPRRYLAFYDPPLCTAGYIQVLGDFFPAVMPQPSRSTRGRRQWLCQDNAPCHVTPQSLATIATRFRVLRLPPSSPDLNPIEGCWGQLKRNLGPRLIPMAELRERVLHAWRAIPNEYITNAVASMPERCRAVLRARGGYTRY